MPLFGACPAAAKTAGEKAKAPAAMKMRRGTVFEIDRKTAVRTPDLTPITLMAVNARSGRVMASPCPHPARAAGQR